MKLDKTKLNEIIEYSRTGKLITPTDRALDKILSGLVIVTTCYEEIPYGMTAAWFSRASNEPYLVTVSISENSYTHGKLIKSGNYALNILDESQKELASHFGRNSGRDVNKFMSIEFRLGKSGSPILYKNACAFMDCQVIDTLNAGDHTVFLGKVLDAEIIKPVEPLVYHRKDFP